MDDICQYVVPIIVIFGVVVACIPNKVKSLFSKLSKFIVSVGGLTETVDKAIQDNVITDSEAEEIKSKLTDAVESGKDLLRK